ncbi:MAG TPA: sugar phosphate isomerase/epimerase [Firmicutes bacterium]|nr:sugar phosphate isomerase/epimerase [Bacillota bacterium]
MTTCLAAQLYTVRESLKTPADIAASLRKVRQIGYKAVQLSGLGPIDPKELRAMLDDNELTVCATHYPFERMQNELDAVLAEHEILGCKNLAVGSLPGSYRQEGADGYRRFAQEASAVARKVKEAGFTWSYHNHSFELEKFGDKTALAILYAESDPEVFLAEIDTYWIQHGGGDPAQWIADLSGRQVIVHLKDMTMQGREQIMAEVGEGNLNWPRILQAAKEAGVRWYAVEQDRCQRDPFESLAISYRNLRAMGLE